MRSIALVLLAGCVLVLGVAHPALGAQPAAASPKPRPRAQAAGWVKIQAQTIVLQARRRLKNAEVLMQTGPARAAGWNAPQAFDVITLSFRRKGAAKPAASYILSPWQRLWWMGTGLGDPDVVSVNRYSIVLGPVLGEDRTVRGAALSVESAKLMQDVLSVDACEKGTQIGRPVGASPRAVHPDAIKPQPIYRFKRYYLRFLYPAVKPGRPFSADKTAWSHLVAARMLLLIRRKADPKAPGLVIRYDWYPPADVIRTRFLPPLPGEQRLAPGVDLAAAGRKMDRGLQKVFGDAATALLKLEGPADEKARLAIARKGEPELRKVIFAYPGHTGPAHAAGAAAFEKARDRLRRLASAGQLDCCQTGSWPAGPVVYRPALLDELRKLPPATLADLPALLDAFGQYEALAKKKPGMAPAMVGRYMPSDPELILAEVGDRIRTVVARAPRNKVEPIFKKRLKGRTVLAYNGFDLWIKDPVGKHIAHASTPVKITIRLEPAKGPGLPRPRPGS